MDQAKRRRRDPRNENAQETVRCVLDAAERVLGDEGYAALNTNKIAKVAGVAVGTLYHYFPTKEAVFEAVMRRAFEEELSTFLSTLQDMADMPIDDAIRRIISKLCGVILRRYEMIRRWRAEAMHLTDEGSRRELRAMAKQVIVAAIDLRREYFRPVNHDFAATFFVLGLMPFVRESARAAEEALRSGVVERELSDMVVRYLVRDEYLGRVPWKEDPKR